MNFTEARARKAQLEAVVMQRSTVLHTMTEGLASATGLTPDAVRLSPEYKAAKLAYVEAFNRLRAWNAQFVKAFKVELRADRRRLDRRLLTQDMSHD